MPIEWSGRPITKAELSRGKPWSYTLPLRDENASVRWHCRTLPRSTWECDPARAARITVHVPDDLDVLFGELTWSVSGENAESAVGSIVFRVTEARRDLPGPAAEPLGQQSVRATTAVPLVAPESASAPAAETVRPATLVRYIEVFRGGVAVRGLHVEIRPGRTVTIGRGSHLTEHDLNLAGRFETDDDETFLSRRQAEVFCNDDGVFIRNVGRHRLELVDVSGVPVGDVPPDHRWNVGETIGLPGGLSVVLRER